MVNLKTLKDLKDYDMDDDGACGDPDCCGDRNYYIGEVKGGAYKKTEELRTLLIECVKELRRTELRKECGEEFWYCPRCEVGFGHKLDEPICWDCEHKAEWIMSFDNLSDEDLK